MPGPKGDTGPAGSDATVNSVNITSALGFIPKNYVAGENVTIVGDTINAMGNVQSVNTKTGAVVINKTDVGLGNVTNDKQATKLEFDTHKADYASFKDDITSKVDGARISLISS